MKDKNKFQKMIEESEEMTSSSSSAIETKLKKQAKKEVKAHEKRIKQIQKRRENERKRKKAEPEAEEDLTDRDLANYESLTSRKRREQEAKQRQDQLRTESQTNSQPASDQDKDEIRLKINFSDGTEATFDNNPETPEPGISGTINISKNEQAGEEHDKSGGLSLNVGGGERGEQSDEINVSIGESSHSEPNEEKTNAKGEQESHGETTGESRTSAVDLSEIRRLQEEIKKESGYADLEIDTHYKRQTDDEEGFTQGSQTSEESAEGEDNNDADFDDFYMPEDDEDAWDPLNDRALDDDDEEISTDEVNKSSGRKFQFDEDDVIDEEENEGGNKFEFGDEEQAESENKFEFGDEEQVEGENQLEFADDKEATGEPKNEEEQEISSEAESQEEGEKLSSENEVTEEALEESKTYREKEEIENRLKGDDRISRIDNDEIAELKRQIALEKGLISVDDLVEANDAKNAKNDKKDEKKPQEEPKPEENVKPLTPEEEAEKESIDLQDDGFYVSKDKSVDRSGLTRSDGTVPPEESLPDDITDEDIENLMKEQEEEAIRKEEAEEEELYEGMSDDEVAEAKERKKKFEELKQRYNSKEISEGGELGDYKKNLDFSVNTSIKRFRLQPPKKPFIITAIVVGLVAIIASLITYFVLNRPAPPITLTRIEVNYSRYEQRVDERLDLTGITIISHFSDDSTTTTAATYDMIRSKSENIDDDFVITSYSTETYVVFGISNFTARINITLSEAVIDSISAEIYQGPLTQGSVIKFDSIYLVGKVTFVYGSSVKRDKILDPRDAEVYLEGRLLERTEDGFKLPATFTTNSGEIELEIRYTVSNAVKTCRVKVAFNQ